MAEPPDAQESSWAQVLAQAGLGQYCERLVAAAIDTPHVLATMVREDAMDILKELDVLPGHRHRLLEACVNVTPQGGTRHRVIA